MIFFIIKDKSRHGLNTTNLKKACQETTHLCRLERKQEKKKDHGRYFVFFLSLLLEFLLRVVASRCYLTTVSSLSFSETRLKKTYTFPLKSTTAQKETLSLSCKDINHDEEEVYVLFHPRVSDSFFGENVTSVVMIIEDNDHHRHHKDCTSSCFLLVFMAASRP